MNPGLGSFVAFLVVGAVLVFVDGHLIWRSGKTYLEEVYADAEVADSVNRLIAALFHLSVLGVLALISTVAMNVGSAAEEVVARTGVMLLVLAVAHGITIWSLGKIRSRQRQQRLDEELAVKTEQRLGPNT